MADTAAKRRTCRERHVSWLRLVSFAAAVRSAALLHWCRRRRLLHR